MAVTASFSFALNEMLSANPSLLTDVQSWDDPQWELLSGLISTSDLDSSVVASRKMEEFLRSIFADGTITMKPKKKTLERFAIKRQRTTYGGRFKAVSDLVAARIECDLHQIRMILRRLEDAVAGSGLYVCRNPIFDGHRMTDIVAFVFIWLPEIGFVTEIQVGHALALNTFHLDSALRDNPDCGYVNLWKEDYYERVRAVLLAEVNDTPVPESIVGLRKLTEVMFLDASRIPAEMSSFAQELLTYLQLHSEYD